MFHVITSLRVNGDAMKFQHSVKRRKFSYAFFVCERETESLRVFYASATVNTMIKINI